MAVGAHPEKAGRKGGRRMLYLVIGLYLAALLAIGFFTARKTKTIADFFLGNRTARGRDGGMVNPWRK